jgi:hypothetical protein
MMGVSVKQGAPQAPEQLNRDLMVHFNEQGKNESRISGFGAVGKRLSLQKKSSSMAQDQFFELGNRSP